MRGTVAKRLRRKAAELASVEAGEIGLLGRTTNKYHLPNRVTAYYPANHFRRIYRDLKKAHRKGSPT